MTKTLTILATLIAIVGGVGGWFVFAEDRYVNVTENIQSMQGMKQYYDLQIQDLREEQKHRDYNYLTEQYYMKKRMLRANPNDNELKEEFQHIKKRRETLGRELGM